MANYSSILKLKKSISIFFFHHTTCGSTCDTLASSAAIQGDNTVSVAQGEKKKKILIDFFSDLAFAVVMVNYLSSPNDSTDK